MVPWMSAIGVTPTGAGSTFQVKFLLSLAGEPALSVTETLTANGLPESWWAYR